MIYQILKKPFFISFFCIWAICGLFANDEDISPHEYYNELIELYQEENWNELISACEEFMEFFPNSNFIEEVYYYLGMGYFYSGDYEFSNDYFTKYLRKAKSPKYFEETLSHKFYIAEEFRLGAKKRMFKWQKTPVWLSAKEDALKIYDEIIHTLPYHELSALSLYGKAKIQGEFEDFKESVETYQLLIKRFPKHEYSLESFIEIGVIYLEQCKRQHLDPDILDLAVMNFRKFSLAFPGEPRLEEAQKVLNDIEEVFAENLYETGRFYERTKKQEASIIYYSKTISKFPETKAAKKSQIRLDKLKRD